MFIKTANTGTSRYMDSRFFNEIYDHYDCDHRSNSWKAFLSSMMKKSLSSFLQLIAMEQQTCLLRVYSRKKDSKGLLYFKDGVLYDAVCRNKQGEQAGVEMIGWEDIEITFLPIPKNKIRRRVKGDLMSIILDCCSRI